MYCSELHAWWSTLLNFAFLFNCTIAGQALNGMARTDVASVVMTTWGLTVGFLLLRYSVVCTVESLYLFYDLFIS